MYSSLDIDPTVYPVGVTIARPSGRDLDAQQGVLSCRCFGVHSPTDPYFDPAGALPGELAPLAFDHATGTFFLTLGETPDIHMMVRARAARHAARTVRQATEPQAQGGAR